MFALPPMTSVPVYSFGGGGIDWPWLAPLVAWTLVATLIASVVSLLRSTARRIPNASGRKVPRDDDQIEFRAVHLMRAAKRTSHTLHVGSGGTSKVA